MAEKGVERVEGVEVVEVEDPESAMHESGGLSIDERVEVVEGVEIS